MDLLNNQKQRICIVMWVLSVSMQGVKTLQEKRSNNRSIQTFGTFHRRAFLVLRTKFKYQVSDVADIFAEVCICQMGAKFLNILM